MGYSGYTQYLCTQGHKTTIDCWDDTPKHCSHCKESFVWRNAIDTTNGSYCTAGWYEGVETTLYGVLICTGCEDCVDGRIDGYVEFETISDNVLKTCPCCDYVREIEPARFKIPSKGGQNLR